jgi:hypothetical protein
MEPRDFPKFDFNIKLGVTSMEEIIAKKDREMQLEADKIRSHMESVTDDIQLKRYKDELLGMLKYIEEYVSDTTVGKYLRPELYDLLSLGSVREIEIALDEDDYLKFMLTGVYCYYCKEC